MIFIKGVRENRMFSRTPFFSVPSMALNLAVKVRYGGTYQPTISEAQAIRREARSGESV